MKRILPFLLLLCAPLVHAQVYPQPKNVGLAANRPTYCDATGQLYYATDTSTLYYSTVAGTNCTWATVGGSVVANYQTVETAGTPVAQQPNLNFLTGFDVANNAGNHSTDLSFPTFYQTIELLNSPMTQRKYLNFLGGHSVVDDPGNNSTDIGLLAPSVINVQTPPYSAYGKSRCIAGATQALNCQHATITTDGDNTVTCSVACFTSADVGKNIWSFNSQGNGGGYLILPNGTTILSLVSSTEITVSTNTLNTGALANNFVIIGQDDTTPLASAWAAANPQGTVYLPCGNYMITSRPWIGQAGQVSVWLQGQSFTCVNIWFSMDYNYSNDGFGQIFESSPISYMKYSDITIDGLFNAPNIGNTNLWEFSSGGVAQDFAINNWRAQDAGNNTCAHGNSDNLEIIHPMISTCSDTGMFINTLLTDIYFPDITGTCDGLSLPEQATNVFGGLIQGGGISGARCAAVYVYGSQSNEVKFFGTELRNPTGPAVLANGTNSTVKLFGVVCGPMPGEPDDANTTCLETGSATSQIWASGSRLYSTGTGYIYNAATSGSAIYDMGGNEFTQNAGGGFFTGSGTIYGSGSITGAAQTTGNIALTSGWSSSSVTAASGTSLREQFTITLGGSPGSSNVVTITFPTPFPQAPLCTLTDVNATTSALPTSITNGSITATTAAFTVNGTFTSGTEVFQLVCSE
jgi:hypothetical protein